MEAIREEVETVNGYRLHVVPNKKFKTINIVVKLKTTLERDTITKRALLPYILQQGPNSYPTRMELQTKLDELYGAVLSIDGAKKGENHVISFRLELANQKFIPNESGILEEAISLLNDVIFNPNVDKDGFDRNIFNREKETLKQKMSSIIDDKMRYANMRLIDEMCEGEPYSIHVHGYEEDLSSISPENTYEYYQSICKEDTMDVFVLGDFETEEVKKLITSTFKRENDNNTSKANATIKKNEKKEANIVKENQNIQQAKLHIGYRTNTTYGDKLYPALQVFNGILGAFPSSKLFINVREKNSLAYYASSRLESHKGLLLVFSGIAPEDFEKAKEIMEQQMDAMKKSDVTDTELSETKALIENQLLETMDNPQGIVELLYQQVIANSNRSPEKLIEEIKQVTKKDLTELAELIEEDTVYLLSNEGGENNE
ncbi:EF-P 5-aminopentanol modification-associated protein YfmF [Ornithinibacillus halophilus]|uniref:Predicted Zn-dependent peptidase n=1 Tax=Ornithinibacillus halophilus TaxID=930117 RepID=A0A1M5CF45_9BACI|nr:pitrilysin family protein [Ornithinibacillus halophilus]SHF53042.1 Predicted Zn-dependent peptidase [Ornithinibacillus halophilus]